MCTSSFTARGGYLHLNCSLRLFHTLWALLPARSLYAVRCVACPCFLYGASAIPRQVGWAARWRGGSSQKDRFVRSTQSALSASSFNLFFLLLGIQPIILFVGPHKQNNYCFLSVFTCTDVGASVRHVVSRVHGLLHLTYTISGCGAAYCIQYTRCFPLFELLWRYLWYIVWVDNRFTRDCRRCCFGFE